MQIGRKRANFNFKNKTREKVEMVPNFQNRLEKLTKGNKFLKR